MNATPGQIIYEAMGGTSWQGSSIEYRRQWEIAAGLISKDARMDRLEFKVEQIAKTQEEIWTNVRFCVLALTELMGIDSDDPAEDEDDPGRDLDGNPNGRPRDQSQPL